MIQVLIVDDSAAVREFLVHILSSDGGVKVIGTAENGEKALEVVKKKRPDVITMDIHMPEMDGLEATRRIMETHPVPIVIVSGSSTIQEATTAFRAIEAGALAVVQRPKGIGHPDHQVETLEFIQTVKLMAEVKVVRRWPRSRREEARPTVSAPGPVKVRPLVGKAKVVAIGASTGGPLALQAILSGLPKDFPVPVLIVQHMAPGFVQGFAEWLAQSTGFPVQVAAPGEYLLPGHSYVAPDGFHLGVDNESRIALSQHEPENGLRPSVSYLFRSVTKVFGSNAIGVLLTGMGKDGAEELKLMKERGALTLAQDEESSVVHGMPGEAIHLDAATYVLSPDRMVAALTSAVNKKPEDQNGKQVKEP